MYFFSVYGLMLYLHCCLNELLASSGYLGNAVHIRVWA